MKKLWVWLILLALLCSICISADASQLLNIYIEKDAFLSHDVSAADIRIRPEGMVRVIRHSLWPWDEEGSRWSLFVEIENISQNKIVIDDTWLIACKANRDEIATAKYVFQTTDNVLVPGERTVLHAGVESWMMPVDYHDVTEFTPVEGLSEFAGKIRQADILRVRLETRGNESTQNWPREQENARVFIENDKVCFEMINDAKHPMSFHTIGAIVSDGKGRIMDVLCTSYSRSGGIQPGEKLTFEKPLQPYVTHEMAKEAQYEVFAYSMKNE